MLKVKKDQLDRPQDVVGDLGRIQNPTASTSQRKLSMRRVMKMRKRIGKLLLWPGA
jgi:hypothetical protein